MLFLLALILGELVESKWLNALKEEEDIHNTAAALRVGTFEHDTLETPTSKNSKKESNIVQLPTPKETPSKNSKMKAEAETLGLIAKWSRHFGFITLHDPTTGELHDLHTKDAPDWAKREAFKRKELWADGNKRAFTLTSREMEEIWEAERTPVPEGIIEDHPVEEEDELETG